MPNAQAYILLGNIGSGKTVQAELLASEINGRYLSIGSLIRQKLAEDPRVFRGELLPHDEVVEIVQSVTNAVAPGQPIIFDGFPRALEQKEWLDQHLAEINRRLVRVFYLKVDEAQINQRLAKRGRADDTPQAITHRKQVFASSVLPVISAYDEQALVEEIDGNQSPEAVQQQIISSIEPNQ